MRRAIASYEMSGAACAVPMMNPESTVGKNPLGAAPYSTIDRTSVAMVTSSVLTGWPRTRSSVCA